MGSVMIALGLMAVMSTDYLRPDSWWALETLLAVGGILVATALLRSLRANPHGIITDHILMLSGSFLVYYVGGALLLPAGSPEQTEAAFTFYPVDAILSCRATAVNFIGFGLALVAGAFAPRKWLEGLVAAALRFGRNVPYGAVIAAFLACGLAASLYVLDFDTSLHGGTIPGIVRTASLLSLVAVMGAMVYRGRGALLLRLMTVPLTAAQMGIGLLLLNKSLTLLPLVALLGGLMLRHRSRTILPLGAILALCLAYSFIEEPVSAGRAQYGLTGLAGWQERGTFLVNVAVDPNLAPYADNASAWSRICYLPAQGAALDFYDSGRGGDDYTKLGWALVPRFLYSEKPIMTAAGQVFYYKISGGNTSSTGFGVFISGYYDLGWPGVIVVGIAVGLILAWTSVLAGQVFRNGSILWLPTALMGNLMAFRIDGTFLADYWGPFILLVYLVAAGATFERFESGHPRLAR